VPILPLSNDIKTASKFPRVLGEVVLANFVVQERDGQRDRQTDRQKKLDIFGFPGGARSPSATKLGMVIEDLKHVQSGAKFYCPHALADGNQRIRIREKTPEFSTVSYIHTHV